MSEPRLDNSVQRHRERFGLSQQALAEAVGASRQTIIAIESGRQVPSTSLSLRLARALRCRVEDLFMLSAVEGMNVRLAPRDDEADSGRAPSGARVAVAAVDDHWVAHRLPLDASLAADGIIVAEVSGRTAVVRPLTDPGQLRRNVIVTGCAPILGTLAQRVGGRFADARATWLAASSRRSLDLLEAKLVHVAGLHLSDEHSGEDNISVIRQRFPAERMLVVNLTRWRQGFVLPAGNPLGIRSGADLLRPGLRMARREDGAGAHRLVRRLLTAEGADPALVQGPFASGHTDVAQLVRFGAADVGVAIEAVAVAAGLAFVPLAEERFDLVVPAVLAARAPISRLIEALDDPGFRAEMAHLPGYDSDLSGHVTTLEAA